MNDKSHNAPEFPEYAGLKQEFRTRCQNLCRHSLSTDVWKAWHQLEFATPEDKIPFPEKGSQDEKLHFIDQYLFTLLLPHNVTQNRRMLPHWRADLNKYRGWLLHRVLMQLDAIQREQKEKTAATEKSYHLPEDLLKIVDDLWCFHKHSVGQSANINTLQDLAALNDFAKPYRPHYPITYEEKTEAHACFLDAGTRKALTDLLPEGCDVTKSVIFFPNGRKIERKWGAELVGLLENGTEVIQLHTEEASQAYGSPRWCTSYRERKTYFEDYRDDLLVVIAPDGQRWQLHLRTGQWKNTDDQQVSLNVLIQYCPGLDQVLADHWLKTLNARLSNYNSDTAGEIAKATGNLIDIATKIPALKTALAPSIGQYLLSIPEKDGQKWDRDEEDYVYFDIPHSTFRSALNISEWWTSPQISKKIGYALLQASKNRNIAAVKDILKIAEHTQEARTAVAPYLRSTRRQFMKPWYAYKITKREFLELVEHVPEWSKAVRPGTINRLLNRLHHDTSILHAH